MFPRRRRWLVGAAAAAGLLLAVLTGAARIAIAERHDIDVLRSNLTSAEKVVRAGPSANPKDVAAAHESAVRARDAADDARRRLDTPLVTFFGSLP